MVGAVLSKTSNYGFNRIRFDMPGWHGLEHDNWTLADALLASIGSIPGSRGIWTNGTPYVVGDRVADPDGGGLYRCAVAHTSAVSGSFADDRAAHMTYWVLITQVPIWAGTWATATNYNAQDIVRHANAYYYCIAAHTSGTFSTDLAAGRWTLVLDLQPAFDAASAAAASASAASGSASAASTSATNAASSASAAASSATSASGSASAAAGSASTAGTQASNASSSASAAAGSASAASGSASAAAGSASTASTQATNAGNSATSASNSATAAGTSATNAANSAAAAATSAADAVKYVSQSESSARQAQARSNIGAPALPTASAGEGQFIVINAPAGNGVVLPAGGTWAYAVFGYAASGTNISNGTNAGVAAGGTTPVAGVVGTIWTGWAWRIA